jgi:hypothetical protein
MPFSDAATGGTGYLAHVLESIPGGTGTAGTPVTPTSFVPVTSQAIKAPWDMVKPEVMRGTRMAMAIMERARLKVAGPVAWELNPSLGLEYFTAALGGTSTLAAVAATATTAAVATINGVSTITVAGTFTVGAWVDVNVSSAGVQTAGTERRQVILAPGGTIQVGALVTNVTAATGIFVMQPAQNKYANSLLAAGYSSALPTLTVESNKGGKWAWRFPGTYVDTFDIAMSKDAMTCTAGLMGSVDPIYLTGTTTPAMVGYAPVANDEKNALRPLTSIDGFIVSGGDPDATGTSTLRAALGVNDVKIQFKNGLLQEACMNGTHTYEVFPGDKASCAVDYTEIATAKRPDVWIDYIEASQATSFFAGGSKNYGTATTPDLGSVGVYIPTMKFETSDDDEKIGSIDTFVRKGSALAPPGAPADYCQIYVVKP